MRLWIHLMVTGHYPSRVPPFGYLRITAYLQLPEAFRSLSRPSSAISAMASTLRSYSLDLAILCSAFLRLLRCKAKVCDFSLSIVSFVRLSTFKPFLTLPVQFSRCVEVISDSASSFRLSLLGFTALSFEIPQNDTGIKENVLPFPVQSFRQLLADARPSFRTVCSSDPRSSLRISHPSELT